MIYWIAIRPLWRRGPYTYLVQHERLVPEHHAVAASTVATPRGIGNPLRNVRLLHDPPFRAMGGLAFVFSQYGLVSADYEFNDISTARISATGFSFADVNNEIRRKYTATNLVKTHRYRMAYQQFHDTCRRRSHTGR